MSIMDKVLICSLSVSFMMSCSGLGSRIPKNMDDETNRSHVSLLKKKH